MNIWKEKNNPVLTNQKNHIESHKIPPKLFSWEIKKCECCGKEKHKDHDFYIKIKSREVRDCFCKDCRRKINRDKYQKKVG